MSLNPEQNPSNKKFASSLSGYNCNLSFNTVFLMGVLAKSHRSRALIAMVWLTYIWPEIKTIY
jgi:hypothetical protein